MLYRVSLLALTVLLSGCHRGKASVPFGRDVRMIDPPPPLRIPKQWNQEFDCDPGDVDWDNEACPHRFSREI